MYLKFLGTFIAVAQLLKEVDDRGRSEIDIFNLVYGLRRERRHMVQTKEQYMYVYKCLLEYMRGKVKVMEEQNLEKNINLLDSSAHRDS